MYAAVPMRTPEVEVIAVAARARPKSATLTRPSSVRMTFSGFTSRCTMPAACAAASASSVGSTTSSASPGREHAELAEHLAQAAALQVLHGEVEQPVVLALVEDGDDTGVRQPRRRPCLPDEPRRELRVVGEVPVHDLERDVAVEAAVEGEVDGGHATARDARGHGVPAVDDATDEGVAPGSHGPQSRSGTAPAG